MLHNFYSKFFLKKEYFSCAQFDEIAELMGVKLREKNRYEFRRKMSSKASFRFLSNMIIFDKSWFNSLSAKAQYAVLVHELWHSKNRKIITSSLFVALMSLGWLLIAGVFSIIIGFALGNLNSLLGLTLIQLLVYETYGMNQLYRRFVWHYEYECDEAAVKNIGAEATKEELNTLKKYNQDLISKFMLKFWASHSNVDSRLEQVDRLENIYSVPIIDIDNLKNE
jgi:hypothetical protein